MGRGVASLLDDDVCRMACARVDVERVHVPIRRCNNVHCYVPQHARATLYRKSVDHDHRRDVLYDLPASLPGYIGSRAHYATYRGGVELFGAINNAGRSHRAGYPIHERSILCTDRATVHGSKLAAQAR